MERTRAGFVWLLRGALLLAVALVLLGAADRRQWALGLNQAVHTVLTPIHLLRSGVSSSWLSWSEYWSSRSHLQTENKRLSAQLAQLSQEHWVLKLGLTQMQQQQLLDNFKHDRLKQQGFSARVLQRPEDERAQHLVLDQGSQQGLRSGMAVVTDIGVIGQITHTLPGFARVRLISHPEQYTPVMLENSQLRTVLVGQGQGQALLPFLPPKTQVTVGERLLTSGLDGVYPPYHPVGVVVSTRTGSLGALEATVSLSAVAGRSFRVLVYAPQQWIQLPWSTP